MIARATVDPDSYYLRLTAHHSLVAAAASIAIAHVVSPALAAALSTSLERAAGQVLGPIPDRPSTLPDVPDNGPIADFLDALAGLSNKPAREL